MKEKDVRDMMEGTPTEVSLDAPVGEERGTASRRPDRGREHHAGRRGPDRAVVSTSSFKRCWVSSTRKNEPSSNAVSALEIGTADARRNRLRSASLARTHPPNRRAGAGQAAPFAAREAAAGLPELIGQSRPQVEYNAP